MIGVHEKVYCQKRLIPYFGEIYIINRERERENAVTMVNVDRKVEYKAGIKIETDQNIEDSIQNM
jgi:hypothetical protein